MGFLPIEFSLDNASLVAYTIVATLFSLSSNMFEIVVFNKNECTSERSEGFLLTSLLLDQNEEEFIESFPNELIGSKEFMKKAVEMCGTIVRCECLNKEFLQDRDFVLRAVNNAPISLLEEIPLQYRNDDEIVFKSCSFIPAWDAELMSDRLKSDKSFLLKVIENDPPIFKCISPELKTDTDFIMECLDRAGTTLFDYIPDWILESIVKDINILKSVSSKRFIRDYFARAASKFLPHEVIIELSNDREFAYQCIKNQSTAASFFSPDIRKEIEFIKLSKNLNIAPDKTVLDREFLKEMYSLDIQNFHYMPDELKNNKTFVLELMEINGLGLEFLSSSLRTDHDIIQRAIQQNGSSLNVALTKERRNKKLQEMATETSGYFEYLHADNMKFWKHFNLRLEKEYFGFDIPKRFCSVAALHKKYQLD
ncbi:predicted protein [Naegleria gruberi]|uniref:Predicted protein n=1 Tax=Naegleria gruberi TaxID=5762 RepID=D2VVV9_NAEGR|nr:uncharacterized protein NAEGRDRAFT_73158 [Naegleria gruberi]EFC39111.1 predicted protein [Naegleria gruberi]|eukprot:XP_002671855.1 predicted protein [Naegleria gruberi strain NEG-M]